MSDCGTFELVTAEDIAEMEADGDTIQTRWGTLLVTLAAITGLKPPAAGDVLVAYGFYPGLPELASVGVCESILDICVMYVALQAERDAAGATIH